MEEEDGGVDVSGALADIVLGAQPTAPDDNDPKFNRMMEMAIAQSLQESRFDAYLHDVDEPELQLGLEQSVAFAEALVNRDRQRSIWRDQQRAQRKRIREAGEAAGRPMGTGRRRRRLVFEQEEQTVAEAMAADLERVSSSEAAAVAHGQGAHAPAVAAAFAHSMEVIDLTSSSVSATY